MAGEKYSILSGNVTVLGNFNPAILRPEFIEPEFSNWKLGKGTLVSPADVPLIADIRYASIRLFMDPTRMIAEDTKLTAIQEMSSPKIVRDYLHKLPYTPVQMIGLNLLAEAEPKDLVLLWKNVANPSRVPKIVGEIGHHLRGMTLHYLFPDLEPQLAEVVIKTDGPSGLHVQLTLTPPLGGEKPRLAFNAEFQDVRAERSRVDFFADHFLEVGQMFFKSLDVLGKEAA